MVVIPNTLELTTLWVTPPLAAEVEAHPHLSFESDFHPSRSTPRAASTRRACSPRASAPDVPGG